MWIMRPVFFIIPMDLNHINPKIVLLTLWVQHRIWGTFCLFFFGKNLKTSLLNNDWTN